MAKTNSDPEGEVVSMPVAPPAPVEPGNEVFPVPFARFAASIRHTADEVWTHLLRTRHGRENRTVEEWFALIEKYRHEPAHPGA